MCQESSLNNQEMFYKLTILLELEAKSSIRENQILTHSCIMMSAAIKRDQIAQ